MSANGSAADLAHDHLRHGRAPVPVRGKVPWDAAKGCGLKEWQDLVVTDSNVDTLFNHPSITGAGVRNGPTSGDLADVDLDTPEAAAGGRVFLPPTTCIFGRPSAPRTHYVYTAAGVKTEKFIDITPDGKPGATLVELRGAGSQSVWPGSLRLPEEEGEVDEVVRFEEGADGPPSPVNPAELRRAVVLVAVCALLARHWPRQE